MAKEQAGDNNEMISALGTVLGAELDKQRKKAEPIPDVYKSGMRGSEKPPHIRAEEAAKDKAAKAAKDKAQKGKDKGRKIVDEDGNVVVSFKAKPKVKTSEVISKMQKQIDDLTKALGKQGKQKTKVKIA